MKTLNNLITVYNNKNKVAIITDDTLNKKYILIAMFDNSKELCLVELYEGLLSKDMVFTNISYDYFQNNCSFIFITGKESIAKND